MCQEVHLADVRLALIDFCEDDEAVESESQIDDLLAQFDDPFAEAIPHVIEHRMRGVELDARGDRAGAHIHRALQKNMARALRGRKQ